MGVKNDIKLSLQKPHRAALFLKRNILNVYDTYKLCIGIFMYKHHKNHLSCLTKHIQTPNYLIRNTQDYIMNRTKQGFFRFLFCFFVLFCFVLICFVLFSYRAIRNCGPVFFFNSLNKTIKECKSTKTFYLLMSPYSESVINL